MRQTTVTSPTPPGPLPLEVPRFTLEGVREAVHHLLLWQARGQTRAVVEGTHLTLTAGNALWLPADTDHRLTIDPNSALMPMFFESALFRSPSDTAVVLPIDAQAETLCLALIGSQYSLLSPAADLQDMVLALVQSQVVAPTDVRLPRSIPALRVARSLLLDPADQRTLGDWAAELHVSTRTLERAFRAETGSTWLRWRQDHRMRRAVQLLRTTSLRVTEVAARVGFATPSAFARAFREEYGVAPTRFRSAG
jgi:AraC-like DNA-binding protein